MNPLSRIALFVTLAIAFGCDSTSSSQKKKDDGEKQQAILNPPKSASASGSQNKPILPAESLRAIAQATTPSDSAIQRYLFGQPEERLWASFALGRHCLALDSDLITKSLVEAVSLWSAELEPPDENLLQTSAWALGRCASSDFEDSFRPWLSSESQAQVPELLPAAILGLSTLVDRGTRLSERTQTLILDVAQREDRAELLLPLGRQGRLSDAVGAHLLEVAGAFLTGKKTEGRRQAIFALGSAGPSAAVPLKQVLLGSHYSVQERAASAQALGRLGAAGQKELDEALFTLLEGGLPDRPDHPLWIPLITSLSSLETPNQARVSLQKLPALALPSGDEAKSAAQRRRLIWLRCRAAGLVAGAAESNKNLLNCDPSQGRIFALAQLQVLDRGELRGARLEIFLNHLKSEDPVISQAALRLLATHPEITSAQLILKNALGATNNGTKTLAAQLIHAYPRRALEGGDDQKRNYLVSALGDVFESKSLPQETRAAAMMAVGALGALNLKSKIMDVCSGEDPLLWEPATNALSLLGEQKATCPGKGDRPIAVHNPPVPSDTQPTTLVIDSDLGELRLTVEPKRAPQAVAHFLMQVDSGHYDQQHIIFGRYGLTVQFGDQNDDGYDDIPAPGLPFEVSPEPFSKLSVGMGSFAPGAENTQLFVTVSDAPQLFGTRIHLGHAEGPWELLVWGDELRTVKRLTK
jgi:cyclophilin family peptidyl-prolyl cis-trans isomerase